MDQLAQWRMLADAQRAQAMAHLGLEADSEPETEWETSSEGASDEEHEGAAAHTAGYGHETPDWFGPPPENTSPLCDSADEIILSIISNLVPPLFLEPQPGDLDSLKSFSSVSKRFRAIAWPFLFRRVCLSAPTEAHGSAFAHAIGRIRNYCDQLLLRDDVSKHVRALWVDVPNTSRMPPAMINDTLNKVFATLLSHTSVLVLRNFDATPELIHALSQAANLRILDVDDGFNGSKELAQQLKDQQLKLREVQVYYCSVSTSRHSSAVPFGLLQGMERVERLVIRAFKDRFPAGLFPSSLWSHLRVLALDSGNAYNTGLISLFEEFKTISKHQPCPLEEVYLEIRDPVDREFQNIVACFRGHQPLKKLNLMVLPTISPALIADLAGLLPQIEELNLVALASRTILWLGEPTDYATAIAAFPKLRCFGFNGVPDAHATYRGLSRDPMEAWALTVSKSKSLQDLIVWHHFGDTDYHGRLLRLERENPADLTQVPKLHDNKENVTFFPLRETVIEPAD